MVFEQESYAFGRFLPGFLLPGPLAYSPRTDSFITVSSCRQVESYKWVCVWPLESWLLCLLLINYFSWRPWILQLKKLLASLVKFNWVGLDHHSDVCKVFGRLCHALIPKKPGGGSSHHCWMVSILSRWHCQCWALCYKE